MKIMDHPDFWGFLDILIKEHDIVIDRPKGSYHPEHKELYYALDYGYLEGTQSPDGECIDVWIGSDKSLGITGALCCVDIVKNDTETKLLYGCTDEDKDYIYHFYNDRDGNKAVLIGR